MKTLLELSVKSCPVGPELHPSFDASSHTGSCPQSHEIASNKGMKNGRLRVKCTRHKNIL
jgi:hypothetical protein